MIAHWQICGLFIKIIMTQTLLELTETDHLSENLNLDNFSTEIRKLNTQWPLNMTVLSLNIRSISGNYDNLLTFLHTLDYTISIIMITETWLREDRVDLYPIDGYNQFAICRKSRGGGLLMYVHRSIEVSLVPSLTKISNACESLFVKFNINNASHYAGVVYRSPNRPIADFISAFDKLCISLPKNDWWRF